MQIIALINENNTTNKSSYYKQKGSTLPYNIRNHDYASELYGQL